MPLPKTINPYDILDFIIDLCANEEIINYFCKVINEMSADFDMHSAVGEGRTPTGEVVDGYMLKFIDKETHEEVMYFLPVRNGQIFEIALASSVNSKMSH